VSIASSGGTGTYYEIDEPTAFVAAFDQIIPLL
jgi:hypothetical protein